MLSRLFFPVFALFTLSSVGAFQFPSTRIKMSECSSSTKLKDSLLSSMLVEAGLSSLIDTDGTEIPLDKVRDKLHNKRVALYFAAGWCPMCTRFEPSLLQFQKAASESSKPVEFIYIPSDRSASDHLQRSRQLGMITIPFGGNESNVASSIKERYNIWSGSETPIFGTGRRSGVPALIVLNNSGKELTFLATEAEGVKALEKWPIDDATGVW